MPAVARSQGADGVLSPDGTGKNCAFPMNVTTGSATQTKVTADMKPVVVQGDKPQPHPMPGCNTIDQQPLSSFSSKVSAAGKKVGRIGDMYGNNIITSGSSKVFCI